ncbi:MAG: hypothetical protein GXY41_05905 [Phycisphaerae bacterium]|nr:hypothetical protein [Phycisphaerae bacterium]
MDIDTLIHEIKQAFGDLPPPKDKEILRKGMAKAEYGGNKTAGLGGVRWQDLPERCYSEETNWYSWPWLDDLTPLAFCYYLPGYMIIAAQHYNQCDSDHVVQNLILDWKFVFDESTKSDSVALVLDRTDDLLSEQQKHEIKMVLEYLTVEFSGDKSDIVALFRKRTEEKRKTFDLFSVHQKHAIRLFLEYLIAEYAEDIKIHDPRDTPQEALAQYWNKY